MTCTCGDDPRLGCSACSLERRAWLRARATEAASADAIVASTVAIEKRGTFSHLWRLTVCGVFVQDFAFAESAEERADEFRAALARVEASARREERERAAKVACDYCRDGHPVEDDRMRGHRFHLGAYTGHTVQICYAAAIRALASEERNATTPPRRAEAQGAGLDAPADALARALYEAHVAELIDNGEIARDDAPPWDELPEIDTTSDDDPVDRRCWRTNARYVTAMLADTEAKPTPENTPVAPGTHEEER